MPKTLNFDPSRVFYALRYLKRKKADGTYYKASGPYWYCYWNDAAGLHTRYIGKELPDECIPFVKNKSQLEADNPSNTTHKKTIYKSYDQIRAALDRGNQIVIDIASIADYSGSMFTKIGPTRFLLYRDPPNNETTA